MPKGASNGSTGRRIDGEMAESPGEMGVPSVFGGGLAPCWESPKVHVRADDMDIQLTAPSTPVKARPLADLREEEAENYLRVAQAATVLVVDDDEGIRSAVAEILESLGFRVAVACDGIEAGQMLAVGLQPNAIVLDMMMPRMDGWTFLDRLRGDEKFKEVPVVVASAVVGVMPEGADALLQKPFSLDDLRREVSKLCAH